MTAVETVLTNRGIELSEIQHYLSPTEKDVYDPGSIERLHEGVCMLISHVQRNDKVLIQVDSDCDGFTSSAILINYLNCLFPGFVQNNIAYRTHTGKQHGILMELVPEIIEAGYKLVIAPDSSSNDYEAHQMLKENGIDVLVIDHHEADKLSEYACVINNQMCDYPTKSLSGAGMVYKFCCYIDKVLNVNFADQYIDLTAFGMVADMMDLRDFETRFLVNKGLGEVRNPYLRGMVEKQKYQIDKNGGLNPHTVGFFITPYVNAITRVGTQDEKLMLFESMLDYRGYEQVPSTKRGCKGQVETRVEQACRNCTNVKNRQSKAEDASLEIIERIIEDNNLLENKILVIALEPEYAVDRNIAGLVANKLASRYQRPTLVLNKVEEEVEGDKIITWQGSARGYDKSAFKNFKDFCSDSPLVEEAQGHQNAFGFKIYNINLKKFIDYANEALKDFDFTPRYNVDLIWKAEEESFYSDILKIAELESVWGQGVEKPLVCLENVKVHSGDLQLLKETTLKITLPNGTSLIKFGSSEEEYNNLYSELGCVTINVVGECKRNVWNGKVSPQIEIKDYEIVGREEYYF